MWALVGRGLTANSPYCEAFDVDGNSGVFHGEGHFKGMTGKYVNLVEDEPTLLPWGPPPEGPCQGPRQQASVRPSTKTTPTTVIVNQHPRAPAPGLPPCPEFPADVEYMPANLPAGQGHGDSAADGAGARRLLRDK